VEEGREEITVVRVFPNPGVKGVSFLTKGEGYLKIYDVSGKLVYEEKITSKLIKWNGKDKEGKEVKKGVYFYKIVTLQKEVRGKFVIVK
jgi:flagellar hook assembly protein FlgD